MSVLRSLNLRPLLRTPAPTLVRGIRNWDVNTPTEGAEASSIQGDSQPTLDSANEAQESENTSAADQAFANANKNFMKNADKDKNAGELNKSTVDQATQNDMGKVSGDEGSR